jgi:hypothetical protein
MGHGGVSFDWLGGWALLGLGDDGRDWRGLELSRMGTESLIDLPLFAAIAIKSPAAAMVFLTALRKMATDAAPGMAKWGSGGKHKGVDIVEVSFDEQDRRGRKLALRYAFCGGALWFSLDAKTLKARLDDCKSARLPRGDGVGKVGGVQAPQWITSLDLAGPWAGVAVKVLVGEMDESIFLGQLRAADAEAVWRALGAGADPAAVDRLARATFGTRPTNSAGQPYTLGPEGLRDAGEGSRYAPTKAAFPRPGSTLDRMGRRVTSLRSEVGIDDEPAVGAAPVAGAGAAAGAEALESLHVRLKLTMPAPKKK